MYGITGCSVEKQNSDRKNSVRVRFNVGAFIAVKLILNENYAFDDKTISQTK